MSDPTPLLSPEGCTLGFWSAVASLAVSMLGTGIVAFPYAFALCGYILAPTVLILLGILAHLSYASLIQCTKQTQVASYGGLLQTIPTGWGYYTNAALWLLLIMATAAYVLISGDIIRSVVLQGSSQIPFVLQNRLLFAVILGLIFPMCLLKSLHGLSVVSTYCSFAILAVVGLIVWESFNILASSPPPGSRAPTPGTEASSLVLAVPIFGCAMFGHMNISQIYAELRPMVKPQAPLVAFAACAGVVVLYMTIGAMGYAAFGRTAMPDIVAQIAAHNGEHGTVCVIQALLASFIVLKTPLIVLPLRTLSIAMVAPEVNPAQLPICSHVAATFGLLACVYVVAIALPDLDRLLEILGATSVVPLCFVVPARLSWSVEAPRPTTKCVIMGLVGILASVFSLLSFIDT